MNIEINFKKTLSNFDEIVRIANIEGIKENLECFVKSILKLCSDITRVNYESIESSDSFGTAKEIIEQVLTDIPKEQEHHLIGPLVNFINVNNMDIGNQALVSADLGRNLNKVVYDGADKINASSLSFNELKTFSKDVYFENIDVRIKSFVDALTEKKQEKSRNPFATKYLKLMLLKIY